MREIEQLNISYSTDEKLCSVFVGDCPSRKALRRYLEKDYRLLREGCIGFEMGVDFGINTYDEDFAVILFQKDPSRDIDEIVKYGEVFDIKALKRAFPEGLDRPCNCLVVLGRMNYQGAVKAVNGLFGHFKFLGVFDSL